MPHPDDPSARVAAAFRRIQAERMADLPVMLNPALAVEAVGFRRHGEDWLGVLVTPWAMNLILLPATGQGWQMPPDNRRRFVRFPSGDYAFLGGEEPEIGQYQICALIAAMGQFVDQETAVLTARAALIALLQEPAAPGPEPAAAEAPSSPARRGFLTGRIDRKAGHA